MYPCYVSFVALDARSSNVLRLTESALRIKMEHGGFPGAVACFAGGGLLFSKPVTERNDITESPDLRVTLDQLMYQPPEGSRPHCFNYFISIHNDGDVPVTIKGRKWVVRNDCGEVTAVEGEGVVGQMPTIHPGESFSYNSFHLVTARAAVAEGSYLGMDANGRKVFVRIPKFEMTVPG